MPSPVRKITPDAAPVETDPALPSSATETTTAEAPVVKPKRARKRKTTAATAEPTPTPPAPPTACNECHTPFDRRDAFYVPARAGALCKRCWQRQERQRLTHGRLAQPAPTRGGSNRAQQRAAGVRNRQTPHGAYPLQLDLSVARPKTQSSGRRARKRHQPPCLCCWTPTLSDPKQQRKGAA